MANNLKVALLQISPTGSLVGNMEKGEKYCCMAKEMGADIALFPEMFSNGYDIYERDAKEWKKDAIGSKSEFVESFGILAKKLDMAIGITFLEDFKPLKVYLVVLAFFIVFTFLYFLPSITN